MPPTIVDNVRVALDAGVPAARVFPHSARASDAHPNEVRIAFDGDAVLFSDEAERFYRNGPPFLQRYLPFWLANLVERMWLALGLIAALLLPLSRVVPPLYEFRIRSRVFRWYGQLREIEQKLHAEPATGAQLVRELDALDEKVENISVPLAYADELYALRNNINLVRSRLQERRA